MFDQINKYKASFGRLFEAKTLKVMLEIALLTILLSFLGPIKNMIYTEVVNKLSLGITVKLGIIMFASYIVVQVIEECVSYFQIYLNTVLQLKLGQSVSHEINNKLAKVKLNSLEMYEIHDLVSRANQTIKSSIVSSLNLIIALYTPLATIVLQLASLVWVAWYVPILIAVFNVPYIFILVKSNHRRYELERKITKEKRVEKYFVELLSDRYAAKDIRTNGVELSGGQWKRIALYRTLHKKDVDLIVLDEPTANLDPKISENIINRLLKPNYNKTVIVITHDFELAKKFDRIIGMKEGKIICDSPPQAFAWELFEKHNSDKRSLPQIG